MSEPAHLKNALVASLFELANAAQNTAAATVNLVNYYKTSESSSPSLNKLAETLVTVNGSTTALSNAGDTVSQAVATLAELPRLKKSKHADDALIESIASELDASTKQNGAPAKKKPKVEKDPNAPKKPLTMYFAYSFDIREKLKEDRKRKGLEPLSAVAMNDIIKEKWASITAEEKEKWQKKYQQEYGEYQKLKDAYDATKKAVAALAPTLETLPVEEETDFVKSSKPEDGEDDESGSKKSKKRKDGEKSDKKAKKSKK